MEGLKDFTGEGFFDMEEEEQKKYENMIFHICNEILTNMEREFPHNDVKHIYTTNLRELERHFILEEDYEMSYLINNTIKRLNNEYKQ